MNQPTKDQVRKLWEWCGLSHKVFPVVFGPEGSPNTGWYVGDKYIGPMQPYLDLNNLFRYAVPKVNKQGYAVETLTYARDVNEVPGKCSWAEIKRNGAVVSTYALAELEDALFWAIYSLIGAESQS